jgi:hypothetical protein
LLAADQVSLDLVILGRDAERVDLLKRLAASVLEVPHSDTVLSDDVLASQIGPGPNSKIPIAEYAKADPGFAQAVSLSIEPEVRAGRSSSIGMLLEPAVARPRGRVAKQAVAKVRKPPKPGAPEPKREGDAEEEKK